MVPVCGKKPGRLALMRYTKGDMGKIATALTLFLVFSGPVYAQTTNLVVTTQPNLEKPIGEVDILVEADTYVPSFYRGRAEPSPGNIARAAAIPRGVNHAAGSLSYRWSINGQSLADTGQSVSFTIPPIDNLTIRVLVTQNGRLVAEKTEMVAVSEPRIIFYENNALRGIGSTAIQGDFLLMGEEASVSAEPYFFGRSSIPFLQGTWSVDGEDTGVDAWRTLSFTRPEQPADRYLIALELVNPRNFAEATENDFYLYLGI